MNCKFCNAEINDDAIFCTACGSKLSDEPVNNAPAEVQNSQPTPPANTTEPDKKEKKKLTGSKINTVELIAGIFFFVIGLFRAFTTGSSIQGTSFGADFYTYTYRGIVECAEILADIGVTMGFMVAAIGAFMIFNAIRNKRK